MLDYRDIRAATDGVLWDLGAPVRAEATTALAGLDGPVAEDGLAHALADPHPARTEGSARRASRGCRGRPPSTACSRGSSRGRSPATTRRSSRRSGSWSTGRRRGSRRTSRTRLLDPEAPELDERHEDALAALLAADPRGRGGGDEARGRARGGARAARFERPRRARGEAARLARSARRRHRPGRARGESGERRGGQGRRGAARRARGRAAREPAGRGGSGGARGGGDRARPSERHPGRAGARRVDTGPGAGRCATRPRMRSTGWGWRP